MMSRFPNLIPINGYLTVGCFFFSHRLRQKMRAVLQSNKIGPIMDSTKFSRNYKMGSLEGNMIFEGASYLPKEAMLEMTLKAFGYDIDMMEVNSSRHFN